MNAISDPTSDDVGTLGADVLVVASTRRWVADDFRPATVARNLPLVHSWGLEVPNLAGYSRPAWWTPTEQAARLAHAGVAMPLLATGPDWLATLPADLTGRTVWAGPLADIARAPGAGWAKPAEIKVEALPAAWWDDLANFAAAAADAGLPADTWVQVSPTRLDLAVEHRCFIVAGRVVAHSPYLLGDGTTYHEGMEDRADLGADDAVAFAEHVVARLAAGQPPAYVLDVARTSTGEWVVVEGNPAWSSAAYGAAMDGVLATVLAAADHAGRHRRWHWRPDPWLVQRVSRMRPLPRA